MAQAMLAFTNGRFVADGRDDHLDHRPDGQPGGAVAAAPPSCAPLYPPQPNP
jgi:hypothetical protein